MTLKTVKDIRDEKWAEIKRLAARQKIKIGRLIENMVDVYGKHEEDVWNRVLSGERNLSDKEAEDMKKVVAGLRKDKWFKHGFDS
jgi:hypothetical protein